MSDDSPMEQTTVWGLWSIQHKHKPGKKHWVTEPPKGDPAWWFTSWTGERHRLDEPAEAERHRLEAEHAYDRAYPYDLWADSRMLLRTETHSIKVERVPAMWESPR